MTFDCKDLERALQVPDLLPDAREHAKNCQACSRELWLWGEISAVAPKLREEWETPELWPKIRESIEAQRKANQRKSRLDWRIVAGIAAGLAIGIGILAMTYARHTPAPATTPDSAFLTEQTLQEVEKAESAYRASIDKLTRLAQPKLSASAGPETMAAREKLMVLDSEIETVRSTVSHNRFNSELQTQLAVLYRDKQDTLKEILQRAQ